jgi:diacylglycerol kinase (ATP)
LTDQRRALLLVNPDARRPPPRDRLMEGVEWLRGQGWEVALPAVSDETNLMRLSSQAATDGYDCVVACGGDGTLHGVLNGLAGSSTALACVPAGTANVWAREVNIPSDPVSALRLLEEGKRLRLDTGCVSGRSFLLMASAGLDSLVASQVGGPFKRHLGSLAYLWRAAMELPRFRGLHAEIEIDGDQVQASILGILAGNTRSYGGMLEIASEARADDGLLDVCVFLGAGRRRFLSHLLRTLRGRHVLDESVLYRRAHHVGLKTLGPWPVQADGEVFAQTPVTIECHPSSITVIVPQNQQSPLWDTASTT